MIAIAKYSMKGTDCLTLLLKSSVFLFLWLNLAKRQYGDRNACNSRNTNSYSLDDVFYFINPPISAVFTQGILITVRKHFSTIYV